MNTLARSTEAPLQSPGKNSRLAFEYIAVESGTLNAVGLVGLEASLRWVREQGVAAIRAHEVELTRQLLEGLADIRGATVYGGGDAALQTATVSFNLAGMASSEAGLRLDEDHGIMCRVGLHCAPGAHRTIGTFPGGTVRFGLGAFTTPEEVQAALAAVDQLAREAR